MNMIRIVKNSIALLGLSLLAGVASANNCTFQAGSGQIIRNMPLLSSNLTVGRDVPIGSEIYRQTFKPSSSIKYQCDPGVYTIYEERALISTPLPLANYTGSPAQTGKIYESGVPGIGVGFWRAGTHMPSSSTLASNPGAILLISSPGDWDISLYKIGPISPGVIQGASLPTMALRVTSPNQLVLEQIGLSGSINIVSRTCDTPDVMVTMGEHRTSEFSGVNSATPWQDFSISLNNCPAFYGFYPSGGPAWWSDASVTSRSANANVLSFRLDGTQSAINSSLGILSINPSIAGQPTAAVGIGVQVADKYSTPLPLATYAASRITTKDIDGQSYSIPLRVRYIQTGSSLVGGPANASATFTINYQ